jgi:hypothetical protein
MFTKIENLGIIKFHACWFRTTSVLHTPPTSRPLEALGANQKPPFYWVCLSLQAES